MLKREFADEVTIFTPSDPAQRGCQLSLAFKHPIGKVFACLAREGIICDKREVRASGSKQGCHMH